MDPSIRAAIKFLLDTNIGVQMKVQEEVIQKLGERVTVTPLTYEDWKSLYSEAELEQIRFSVTGYLANLDVYNNLANWAGLKQHAHLIAWSKGEIEIIKHIVEYSNENPLLE